jgi:hypothetical protein
MSQTFGRRTQTSAPKAHPPVPVKFSRPGAPAVKAELAVPPVESALAAPSVDDELLQWKKSRGRNFPIKPLALMASLCFGIASFALPKDINDEVQYPLYALSAASLYIGFRRKRQSR